jgi:hypothetical protein
MRKDKNCTSIHFFIQNKRKFTIVSCGTIQKATRGPLFFFKKKKKFEDFFCKNKIVEVAQPIRRPPCGHP